MNKNEHWSRVEAKSEIHDLAARFSDAVTRGDTDAFGSLWTEDAHWEIHEPYPSKAHGPSAITSMLKKLAQPWAFFVQLTHSGVVEFGDQDSARARWLIREVARSADGQRSYDNLAMYEDHIICDTSGVWRFARRSYHYIWLNESPLVGRSFSLPVDLRRGQS